MKRPDFSGLYYLNFREGNLLENKARTKNRALIYLLNKGGRVI